MIHVRKFNVQCAPCNNDKIKFKYVILNVHTIPMQHIQATLYGKLYFHWRRWRRRQVLFVMVKCLQKQTTSENERQNGNTATVTYTHIECSLCSTIYLWINYKMSGLQTVVYFGSLCLILHMIENRFCFWCNRSTKRLMHVIVLRDLHLNAVRV